MKRIDLKLLLAFCLIFLFCHPHVFSREAEKITLTPERGKITLAAEVTKAGTSGSIKMNVSMVAEKGRISLIGENELVLGYIGENGLFNLARGTLKIDLLDKNNRTVGSIGRSGIIHSIIGDSGRAIIGDCGRIALIGENGKQVGLIGENGRVLLQKNR
jgi:hypothetical protein